MGVRVPRQPAEASRASDCLGGPRGAESSASRREPPIRRSTREPQDHRGLTERVAFGNEAQECTTLELELGCLVWRGDPVLDGSESPQVVNQSIDDLRGCDGMRDDALAGERGQQCRFGVGRSPDGRHSGDPTRPVGRREPRLDGPAEGDDLLDGMPEGRLGTLDHHHPHRRIVPRPVLPGKDVAQLDDDAGNAAHETARTPGVDHVTPGRAKEQGMRRPGLFAMIAFVTLIAAACGGSSAASAAGGAAPGSPDGDEPAAETSQAQEEAGTVQSVTIADTNYNTGSAQVEVSGGRQLAFDGQLLPGLSMTTSGTTLLMYPGGEAGGSVFTISNGPDTGLGFTLQAPDITTGGDATSGCTIELTRNDTSGLAGQFDCRGLLSVSADMPTIDVRGTFSAEP